MRLVAVCRMLLYASMPVVLVVAVMFEVNPSGTRTFDYRIGRPTPMISQLFPAHRLSGARAGTQTILAEPVYFTVRYPHRYDTAQVTVGMVPAKNRGWKIGVARAGESSDAYDLRAPDSFGSVSFDLSHARVRDGKLRFIISAPGLLPDDGIAVERITVTLIREPIVETLKRKLFGGSL